MYKRILLAYDGSEAGQKALLDCREIANWSQSSISLVAVMSLSVGVMGIEGGYYSTEMIDQERQKYQQTLNDGVRRLAEAGYQAHGEVLVGDVVQAGLGFQRIDRARTVQRACGYHALSQGQHCYPH